MDTFPVLLPDRLATFGQPVRDYGTHHRGGHGGLLPSRDQLAAAVIMSLLWASPFVGKEAPFVLDPAPLVQQLLLVDTPMGEPGMRWWHGFVAQHCDDDEPGRRGSLLPAHYRAAGG
ncbi:MAG: hypothetical protein GEV09_24910 [Pseudonocardiaceae bacterium]|nr:hypothetical protein [Pseudonocardiaceae bacterium]